MSKWNTLSDMENGVVPAGVKVNEKIFAAGPGHFGKEISGDIRYSGTPVLVSPSDACNTIENKQKVEGNIAIAIRGQCTFAHKVRIMQEAGVTLAVILDNVKESTYESTALFAMSGDGKDDIEIPAVFLFSREGTYLMDSMRDNPNLVITIGEFKSLKQQYESGCDNGNCETVIETNTEPNDKESFDHLKKVLSQLVAQFELSISNEDNSQKTCSDGYKNENLQDVYISTERHIGQEKDQSVCAVESEIRIEESATSEKSKDSENKSDDF